MRRQDVETRLVHALQGGKFRSICYRQVRRSVCRNEPGIDRVFGAVGESGFLVGINPVCCDARDSRIQFQNNQQAPELLERAFVDFAVLIDEIVDVEATLEIFDAAEQLSLNDVALHGQTGQFAGPDLAKMIGVRFGHVIAQDRLNPAFRTHGDLNGLVAIEQGHGTPHIQCVIPGQAQGHAADQRRDQDCGDQSDAALPKRRVHGAISTSRRISPSSASVSTT